MANTRLITAEDFRDASGGMFYNFAPSKLGRYRAKLAGSYAGLNRVKIAVEGDSLTTGQGAGTSTYFETNAKANNMTSTLTKMMIKAGLITSNDSFFGDNTVLVSGTAGITNYDPRIVFTGSGWTRSNRMLVSQSLLTNTVGDKITFTPLNATSNIVVYAAQNSGFGTYTISDNTTLLSTINAAGSQAFIASAVSRTSSTNAWNIEHTVSGSVYIGGVDTWNTDTQMSIYNLGSSGGKSTDLIGTAAAWSSTNAKNVLNPDLSIINIGTNDIRSGVSVDTFIANLSANIAAHKKAGRDVILVAPNPDNAAVNTALVPLVNAARYSLADTYDIPLIDLTNRYGSYAIGNSLGLYSDTVHQTALGYADQAMAIFEMIRPQ